MQSQKLFYIFLVLIFHFANSFFFDNEDEEIHHRYKRSCLGCADLVAAPVYDPGTVEGIVNITQNSGITCSQMFSCSWINPDGWTSILVYYANGTGPIQYNSLPGEIILNAVFNCTFVNGFLQWTISDFGPDPISNKVICEATPYPSTTGLETTTASVTCPPGGTWSAWNSGACNDTCGMWGTLAQTRTCLSAANGCPCTGASSQQSSYCGPLVCKFPRSMCRAGYTRTALNAQIICV